MADQHATRIILADDHTMLREGLRRLLTGAGFEVIGEASDGQEAVELATIRRPDIVLMDLTMPVLDGIEATKRLVELMPGMKVVMLTMHADAELAAKAVDAGAMGYLVKDCTTEDIIDAVTKALAGEKTFPSADAIAPVSADPSPITQREAEVLQMIADGRSTTQAARELYVSVKTVKNHLASAYAKLDAHDRTQAVLRAARLGLVKLEK